MQAGALDVMLVHVDAKEPVLYGGIVAGSLLSLTFTLHFTPQPNIMRAITAFERSLNGKLVRVPNTGPLPAVLADEKDEHRITLGPEYFSLRVSPLTRADRFGLSAVSLAQSFVGFAPACTPQEMELSANLTLPVPDPSRALGGLAVAEFSWPRKLELRPEALGKDHYLPAQSGIVHLRLSTHQQAQGHELRLLIANRHDRVSREREVIEQAFGLCMTGLLAVVRGIVSPAYQRLLAPLLTAGTSASGKTP